MIPKIIHYCWFGRGPKPQLALDCIESWKKILPEYEIKEWNEDNFDLDMYPYAREAYDNRKFAFVTDVVRLYALYHEGGIYMDSDVEILKPLDSFLHHTAFSGFEAEDRFPTGLMASEKGSLWAKENLDWYIGKHMVKPDGTLDLTTNVKIIMKVMERFHVQLNNTYQDFPGYFTLYPRDVFCPYEPSTKKLITTENSVCIHHFAGSWVPPLNVYGKIEKFLSPIIGKETFGKLQTIKRMIIKNQ